MASNKNDKNDKNVQVPAQAPVQEAVTDLGKLGVIITNLKAEHENHVKAQETHLKAAQDIQNELAKLGIKIGKGNRSGSSAKRGTFDKTARQEVLDFVTQNGPSATSAINDMWTRKGRSGRADTTLNTMVKANQLIKVENPDGRGSLYQLPVAASE